MSCSVGTIRCALVIDTNPKVNSDNISLIDIMKIYPVDDNKNIFLIETEPFDMEFIKPGAGPEYSNENLEAIISFIRTKLITTLSK